MVQVRKRQHTAKEIEDVANSYGEISVRIQAIATAVEAAKLKTVDLKLGTLTGAMFQRIQDSLDTVEANARTSIRKQSRD